jgi:hypothetical protein
MCVDGYSASKPHMGFEISIEAQNDDELTSVEI